MSLILDALRRADAERGRGAVPGLHTPQATAPVAADEAASRLPAIGAAVLLGMALAGAAVFWWQSRPDAEADRRVVLAPAMPAPVPAPAPAAVVVMPPAQAPAEAPMAALPTLQLLPPIEPAPPARVAPVVVAPPPAARVPLLRDLPEAVRQQLPQLAVAGASYSGNPAYRMVIVNGQVLHEGDQAATGVVLESIAEHSVVLRGLGQRWAMPY